MIVFTKQSGAELIGHSRKIVTSNEASIMNKKMTVAGYVRKVTEIKAPRNNKWNLIPTDEGLHFTFRGVDTKDLKVGDTVYIAKLKHTVGSDPFVWVIHQITLPVYRYYFDAYMKEVDGKKKRLLGADLVNHPQTWFGRCTYIVEACKK